MPSASHTQAELEELGVVNELEEQEDASELGLEREFSAANARNGAQPHTNGRGSSASSSARPESARPQSRGSSRVNAGPPPPAVSTTDPNPGSRPSSSHSPYLQPVSSQQQARAQASLSGSFKGSLSRQGSALRASGSQLGLPETGKKAVLAHVSMHFIVPNSLNYCWLSRVLSVRLL